MKALNPTPPTVIQYMNTSLIDYMMSMQYIDTNPPHYIKNMQAVLNLLSECGFTKHHTALTHGYITRNESGLIRSYSGRFGTGFAIETPSFDGTMYHHVTYYTDSTRKA